MEPTSRSSQGSEGSTSPPKPSDSNVSPRSSGTSPARKSSDNTGPTSNDTEMSLPTPTAGDGKSSGSRNLPGSGAHSGTSLTDAVRDDRMKLLPTPHAQEPGWTPDGDQDPDHRPYQDGQHRLWGIRQIVDHLTSSSADSPASLSAPQAGARPKTTTAGSGLSSPVSFATLEPDGSWSRTYPDSSVQASLLGPLLQRFSGTWPRWGSMRDGTVYEHPMSVLRTDESASSSLPTPSARDSKGVSANSERADGREWTPSMMDLPTLLHTPTTGDGTPRYDHRASPGYVRNKPVPNLDAQIEELLPTPGAWLGRRPENATADPERNASRNHEGVKGKRSVELPDAIASIGDHTPLPSTDGSE